MNIYFVCYSMMQGPVNNSECVADTWWHCRNCRSRVHELCSDQRQNIGRSAL